MPEIFIHLFRYFQRKPVIFWLAVVGCLSVMAWGTLRIKLEEDITRFFPDDERVENFSYVFKNTSFSERIVCMVSIRDSATAPQPDTLVAAAANLVAELDSTVTSHGASIVSRFDDDKIFPVIKVIRDNLPVFLEENDYRELDSATTRDAARRTLHRRYEQLISPSGLALKKILVDDPMGLSFAALKKLQQLQFDENFERYENYIVTKDHRHLIFFVQSAHTANETGKNTALIESLNASLKNANDAHKMLEFSAFGATLVAVGNARQIHYDTMLTLSIMVVLLAAFIIGFFKRKRVLLLILVPVIFGAGFSLTCIYLIKGSVSVLALAAGSIILGIAVNYALHFLVHLRHHPDKEQVIRELVAPLTLGSTTTVLAFFSLQFTNAVILRDIGLFAGFSLIGAAICSLIFLPHFTTAIPYQENVVEKIFFSRPKNQKWAVLAILFVTPMFLYFAGHVTFNSDMSALNYMSDETRMAEKRLETINPASLHTVFVSSQGATLQQAMERHEQAYRRMDSLWHNGAVMRMQAVSVILLSDSLQRVRIQRWNNFWTQQRRKDFLGAVHEEGKALKFSPTVLANVDSMVNHSYSTIDTATFRQLQQLFFKDNIIEDGGRATVVSLLNVNAGRQDEVHKALQGSSVEVFDRKMITNLFVEFVHDDFNFIVAFTSILVFVVLLISYGRLEITLITYVPMLLTWIWILGIMALVGIEFNIINVMISTFIFGLGDDYSIFVMDGLQQEYKTGRNNLPSVRTSIFLSALTTISGLGVLIFAQHPALRSIAAIAIIGIVSVFIMSQTIEPFLFRWLITRRTDKKLSPFTAQGIFQTCLTYGIFGFGSIFLTIVGLLFKLVPFRRKHVRYAYHSLISFFTGVVMRAGPNKMFFLGKTRETFSRATIIIANHSSFLDILLTAMQHPKLVLLTNRWVYNSPIFGGVVRLADYYPVMDGAEGSAEQLRARVADGYSVVVFPEGTRSADGAIKRFHKGAFYLAEALQLPVRPLLIQGAGEAVPKGTVYVDNNFITLKYLPLIEATDDRFGEGYSARTKSISQYFKAEHAKLVKESTTPYARKNKLISAYIYKGPVLEWYLRIKLRLEDNYAFYENLVPSHAAVLDLGCGYGFLCYMLQLLSSSRTITGIDYDEEKIAVASNAHIRSSTTRFKCADIRQVELETQDVIIISDVLHYLRPNEQQHLLERCMDALTPGGKIIVRDGNADLNKRHKATRLTEFFSVKLMKFNKADHELSFVSGEWLRVMVQQKGWTLTTFDHGKITSNVNFVITKKPADGTL